MKKLWRLISACALMLGIVSCSNFNESSSLSLTFNGSDFARNSSARKISVNPDYNGYYIVASVLGDYTETKSLQISDSGTYTIEFNSVPVGSEIFVRADVYDMDAEKFLHSFTGNSEKQTVYAGENLINLSMKNLSKNIAYSDNSTIIKSNTSTKTEEVPYINLNAAMIFFPNGKYQVVDYNYGNSEPTAEKVISEGTWSGSFDGSGTIYITECLYKNYTLDTSGDMAVINFNENVIVENPITRGFEYNLQSTDDMRIEEFTINLSNGLKVTQQTS